MITIKSDREIALMREAGNIAMLAHEEIRKAIKPGVSTKELDKIAYDVITSQTEKALEGLSEKQVVDTIIAYEPIWAIGTGKTATKEDANEAIKKIREKICQIYGQNVAERVIIQYGGSMKPSNAKELLEMSDIDGGLIGGASLKADDFANIVNYN